MFGQDIQAMLAQLMSQGVMGLQGQQSPPQARFSGPLGQYGLLAQRLAGGQPQQQQMPQVGFAPQPQIPQMPGRKSIGGFRGMQGLLGGGY